MPRRLVTRTGRLVRHVAAAWVRTVGAAYWPAPLSSAWTGDPRICPACGRAFACDEDWEPLGPEHWRVLMRCGECAFERHVVLAKADAARLEERLAADADAIARAIERLDGERMATEVDAFVALLREDRIAPGDFAAPPC